MDEIMPVILVTALLLVVATGIITLVLLYQKKQLQYLNEKALITSRYEKEILESKLEMQEHTMKHISKEVHDNIGQVLSVVKLNLSLINCGEPVLQEKIADATLLVGKAIQDLRDLSKSLHRDMVNERGLLKAIGYEFEMLKKTGVYTTFLSVVGEPYELPEQSELILFRIFQEAVNNTIKHAGASRIEAVMYFEPDKFLMKISDDGKGFNSQSATAVNSLGIRNIINRSQLIGAYYHIDSWEGEGTSVIVELPEAEFSVK